MMKKIMLTIFFSGLVLSGTAQNKEEEAVSKAVEQLRKAMVDADRAALDSLVTAKLSYGHSSGVIDNKKDFVGKIVSGASDFVTLEFSEQTVIISGKTAIVRHILKAITNDGGKPGEVQLRVLLVWVKQKTGWKLLARQAVRM